MTAAPSQHTARSGQSLKIGDLVPDFRLKSGQHGEVSMSALRGQPVILAFYPADWSPVCGGQMALYNEVLPEFEEFGAALLGISVDSEWSHRAYAETKNLAFPLLADFEPKGAVAKDFGVYRDTHGTSERALMVVDADGRLAWQYVSPIDVNPGADGILEALQRLTPEI